MRIAWLTLLLASVSALRLPTHTAAQFAVSPLRRRTVLLSAQQNDDGTPAMESGSNEKPATENNDDAGFDWRSVVSDPIILVLVGATYYIATSGSG